METHVHFYVVVFPSAPCFQVPFGHFVLMLLWSGYLHETDSKYMMLSFLSLSLLTLSLSKGLLFCLAFTLRLEAIIEEFEQRVSSAIIIMKSLLVTHIHS